MEAEAPTFNMDQIVTPVEGWRPAPGDGICGRVLAIGLFDGKFGSYPAVTIEVTQPGCYESPDGVRSEIPVGQWRVFHAFHTVARNELGFALMGSDPSKTPQPDDFIAVGYMGKLKGDEYESYNVQLRYGNDRQALPVILPASLRSVQDGIREDREMAGTFNPVTGGVYPFQHGAQGNPGRDLDSEPAPVAAPAEGSDDIPFDVSGAPDIGHLERLQETFSEARVLQMDTWTPRQVLARAKEVWPETELLSELTPEQVERILKGFETAKLLKETA